MKTPFDATTCQQQEASLQNTPIESIGLSDTDLNTEQKDKVADLFRKWSQIFSRGSTDLGFTDLVEHEIHLTDDKPFKDPPRHIAPGLFQEIKEHL